MSMTKHAQRLMFLLGIGGLAAGLANIGCLEDVCTDSKEAAFRSMDDILAMQIAAAEQGLGTEGLDRPGRISADGKTLAAQLNRPVKNLDGSIDMPPGWLPPIPADHPWNNVNGPESDAFYSYFEERVLRPMLFDGSNPTHRQWAKLYLEKSRSADPEFPAYTYAERTSCAKEKFDAAGTCAGGRKPVNGVCPKIDAF
ncbi:MAG: hypothetical protein SGI86_17975 [Deltaproteobacteria bacterium]|nr:hypothetical protein [Deltaproteobacteria bacterium]